MGRNEVETAALKVSEILESPSTQFVNTREKGIGESLTTNRSYWSMSGVDFYIIAQRQQLRIN